VVLITGEGGAGKSRLLDRAAGQLAGTGWIVVTGTCPDAGGAPSAWAWTEALRALAEHVPPGGPAETLAALLDPDERPGAPAEDAAAARFRLHRSVVAWLREATATGPVAVLLDDLHQADAETLALLETTSAGLAGSPLLLMAAYRPAEVSGELEQALALLARRSPARLPLAGLPAPDVAALISSVYGGPVDEHIVRALGARTGGNPFYLKESAKLLVSEGGLVVVSEVPEGVRDVLRRRLSRLPPPAVAVLRLAATVGQEADVEVLVDAADTDEDGVIAGLEAGVIAGLLTEPGPGRVRFVHALVGDTVYADLTQLRLARMHARVGRGHPPPASRRRSRARPSLPPGCLRRYCSGRGRLRHPGGRTGGPPLRLRCGRLTAGTGARRLRPDPWLIERAGRAASRPPRPPAAGADQGGPDRGARHPPAGRECRDGRRPRGSRDRRVRRLDRTDAVADPAVRRGR
jgi:AAA ATPase domain